jgi:NAD(P)-dependent dehydrogenase (short-subunit alcohol dehydrogenase family)
MSTVTAQHGGGVFTRKSHVAVKAGVLGLTRGMARELAQHGIPVNAVAPGVVDTDIRVGSDDDSERVLASAVPVGPQAGRCSRLRRGLRVRYSGYAHAHRRGCRCPRRHHPPSQRGVGVLPCREEHLRPRRATR